MPDDEFMTSEETKELFKEWETDYALRREEDANRRLAPPGNASPTEKQPLADILPFPSAGPPRPWPSDVARSARSSEPDQQPKDQGTSHDTGQSH